MDAHHGCSQSLRPERAACTGRWIAAPIYPGHDGGPEDPADQPDGGRRTRVSAAGPGYTDRGVLGLPAIARWELHRVPGRGARGSSLWMVGLGDARVEASQ